MQSAWAIGYGARRARDDDRAAALGLARRLLRRHPAGVLHALGPAPRRGAGDLARRGAASRTGRPRVSPTSSATAAAGLTVAVDAHERLHAVRVVGLQPVAARLSLAARRAGRHRPDGAGDDLVHHRDAGRDVVRLRDLRLHQRRDRPQARLRVLSRDGRGADRSSTSRSARRSRSSCSGRSSRSSRPATSAASARSPRRSIRPTSARRRRDSPTTSAASPAPLAPFTVGTLAQTRGFDVALSTTSIAFVLAAVMWIWIPETRRARELARRGAKLSA